MTTILLIEADPGERLVLRSRLMDFGYEVSLAETGARGIVEVRAGAYDLVLLAAELGSGADGTEVCRRIKSIPERSSLPILVYGRRALGADLVERLLDAGADGVLDKAQLSVLDRVLRVHLRQRERLQDLAEQNRALQAQLRQRPDGASAPPPAPASGTNGDARQLEHLASTEDAAGHPDGTVIVGPDGTVRYADRGAAELLGSGLPGKHLGEVAPNTGLEAFVRDARSAPRDGFRFEISGRKDRATRQLVASVLPTSYAADGEPGLPRVLLLMDLGRRKRAEEALRARGRSVTRQQLAGLLETARTHFTPGAIVGESPVAEDLRRRVAALSARPGNVLIEGERGVGKCLLARVLHYSSPMTGPLLHVRCGSMGAESLGRELFGYTAGSFPEAVADHPGLLLLCQDGTLVLSGVGDLPESLQAELLEVLQSGTVTRRGATRPEEVRVRVVATTTGPLESLVREGRFLPELQRALATHTLVVPPLRERPEDVRELASNFLVRHGTSRGVTSIEPEVAQVLQLHDWPGNVEELEDCIESACLRTSDGILRLEHLPRSLRELAGSLGNPTSGEHELQGLDLVPRRAERLPSPVRADHGRPGPLVIPAHGASSEWSISDADPISFEHYERKVLLRALDSCNGDKLLAAKVLKVGKSTLYRKLKRFGIS